MRRFAKAEAINLVIPNGHGNHVVAHTHVPTLVPFPLLSLVLLIDEPGNAPVTPRNAGDTVGGPCARLISRKQRADNYFW